MDEDLLIDPKGGVSRCSWLREALFFLATERIPSEIVLKLKRKTLPVGAETVFTQEHGSS